jgi:hypothetical protein
LEIAIQHCFYSRQEIFKNAAGIFVIKGRTKKKVFDKNSLPNVSLNKSPTVVLVLLAGLTEHLGGKIHEQLRVAGISALPIPDLLKQILTRPNRR